MSCKHWCILASLLAFACNNGNDGDLISSSAIIEPSSSSYVSSSDVASSSSGAAISSSNAASSSSDAASSSSSEKASSSSNSVSSSSLSSGSVVSSSGSLSYGTRFDAEMLGLTPGATIASLNLNWFSTSANCSSSSTDDGKTLVRLFNASGDLVGTFEGKTAKGPTSKCAHKATMTGLSPNANYKYSVSNNGTDWSNDYSYKTPPSGNAFTFALVADPQITDGNQDGNTKPAASPNTTAQGWQDIVARIAEKEAAFILSVGDQVDAISYNSSQYTKFFAPKELRSIPLAPVVGNHDLHTQYLDHFNMPNMFGTSSYGIYTGLIANYYYLYNNILFVALNTGPNISSSSAAQSAVAEYKKVIEAAKAAHSGYDWLIVQHHRSTTSISSHACDMEIEYLIEAGFEKLMTDQGVDLVVAGHDHIHVRSHLMKWDAAKGYSVKSADKGAIYLTLTTASGVKFYPPFPFSNETMYNAITTGEYAVPTTEKYPVLVDETRGLQAFRKTTASTKDKWPISTDFYVPATGTNYLPNYTPNYTIFEVNGKTIKATTLTSENKLVDEFTLTPKGGH